MAPAENEIEVSVFGRGYGESVLVHLGSGQWVLVDSLRNSDGNPAALVYLSHIGVNPSSAVRYIIATHWHDDHVGGLSQVYAQCPNATISFPIALMRDEFSAFRQAVSGCGSERFGSGVRELESIARLQRELSRPPARYAKANTVLMREEGGIFAHGMPVSVELLSPSDEDVHSFLTSVANATVPEPVAQVLPFGRNDVSVAAWITVGDHRILLGADLEVTGSDTTGWGAIISSPAQLSGAASVFKIPHHGSENGHHPEVWSKLLVSTPTAALAPFSRNPGLPRDTDIDRIVELTPNAFATGRSRKRPKRRDSSVERTLRENGHALSGIPDVGQVRMRLDTKNPSASWDVKLFNGAVPLSALREAS